MINYWLRTNKKENWKPGQKLWPGTQKVGSYQIGDQIIIYVTDGTKGGYYLAAVLEYLGLDKVPKEVIILPEDKWVRRPKPEEWDNLIRRSLNIYSPGMLKMKRNQRMGLVVQQGQQLVKEDFEALKIFITSEVKI